MKTAGACVLTVLTIIALVSCLSYEGQKHRVSFSIYGRRLEIEKPLVAARNSNKVTVISRVTTSDNRNIKV